MADISGDGYADLIIGNEKSGNAGRLNANIYFGSPEGLSERYQTLVPAHKLHLRGRRRLRRRRTRSTWPS